MEVDRYCAREWSWVEQKECGNDCWNERVDDDDDVVVGFSSRDGIQLFIMQMAKDIGA